MLSVVMLGIAMLSAVNIKSSSQLDQLCTGSLC
jgi:hypothetical protein